MRLRSRSGVGNARAGCPCLFAAGQPRADTASNELPDRTDWGNATAMGTPELADYPVTLVTRALYAVPRDRGAKAADRPASTTSAAAAAVWGGAGGQVVSLGDFSGLAAPVSPLGGGSPGDDFGWGTELGASTADLTAGVGGAGGVEGEPLHSSQQSGVRALREGGARGGVRRRRKPDSAAGDG